MQSHTRLVAPGQMEGPVRVMDAIGRHEGVVSN